MKNQLYRIVRFKPLTKADIDAGMKAPQKEILMNNISGSEHGFKFRPNFELECIRSQRATYYNEHCTEVKNWVFNVCSHNSNGGNILMCYCIEEISQ